MLRVGVESSARRMVSGVYRRRESVDARRLAGQSIVVALGLILLQLRLHPRRSVVARVVVVPKEAGHVVDVEACDERKRDRRKRNVTSWESAIFGFPPARVCPYLSVFGGCVVLLAKAHATPKQDASRSAQLPPPDDRLGKWLASGQCVGGNWPASTAREGAEANRSIVRPY